MALKTSKDDFQELSPSEFFYRNREIGGFTNPSRALYSTLRELIENSLDACELHKIKPSIQIHVLQQEQESEEGNIYKIRIRDNGSGVPQDKILSAFGKVFYSSKYFLRQSRGTFGLGGTMAILYGQITTQTPIVITSSTGDDEIWSYKFLIDISRNKPKVIDKKIVSNETGWKGTIVELSLLGEYSRITHKIISYLKHTAVVTPYAEISFIDPVGRLFFFNRKTDVLPNPPKIVKPHPHGIDGEAFRKIMQKHSPNTKLTNILQNEFHRVGEKTAINFLKYANIPNKNISEIELEDLMLITKAMQTYDGFLAPSSDVLSPISEKMLMEGIIKEFNPEYVRAITRPSSSYSGHPFIVEAAIVYGGTISGERGEISLYRYANKIPLLFDEGSDVSNKILSNVNWSYYKKPSGAPLGFFIHICSTKIPFRSLGKEFIADVPEVEREIKSAVRILLRGLSIYARKIEKTKTFKKRLVTYKKYFDKIAEFSMRLAEEDNAPNMEPLILKVRERYGTEEES